MNFDVLFFYHAGITYCRFSKKFSITSSTFMVQKKVISLTKPITQEAISNLYCNNFPASLCIADLGCSSGPNTFFCSLGNCCHSGQGAQENGASIARNSSVFEWSSGEWFQHYFQILAQVPKGSWENNRSRSWIMFRNRSSRFFLWQALPQRKSSFYPFFLQSPLAVSGESLLLIK